MKAFQLTVATLFTLTLTALSPLASADSQVPPNPAVAPAPAQSAAPAAPKAAAPESAVKTGHGTNIVSVVPGFVHLTNPDQPGLDPKAGEHLYDTY